MSQFVNIFGFNNEELRIPLMANRCLSLFNLQHSFPGAVGLKYKNGGDDVYTTLDFNNTYKYFEIPHGGWKGKELHVIYDNYRPASPYSSHLGPLPSYDEIEKYCFKILNVNAPPSAVTCLAPRFFATFKHGFHQKYRLDTKVNVTSHDEKKNFECLVKYISTFNDFIIMKAEKKILDRGPIISSTIVPGESVLLIGHGNEYIREKPAIQTGNVSSGGKMSFELTDIKQNLGPFCLCTIKCLNGDSGGSVFDSKGLLGMCVGHTNVPNEVRSFNEYPRLYEKKCLVVLAEEMTTALETIDDTKSRPKLSGLGDDVVTLK